MTSVYVTQSKYIYMPVYTHAFHSDGPRCTLMKPSQPSYKEPYASHNIPQSVSEIKDHPSNTASLVPTNRSSYSQSIPAVSGIEIELSNPFNLASTPSTSSHGHQSYIQTIPTSEYHSFHRPSMNSEGVTRTSSHLDPLASTLWRDVLLSYAQRDFLQLTKRSSPHATPIPTQGPTGSHSLGIEGNIHALLSILRAFHPTHLPTLLLLGCQYLAAGDFTSSLKINQEILRLEPNYVEAMCNIGCAMKYLDKPQLAFDWWWKALRLRPTYWDAIHNLFDLILNGQLPNGSDESVIHQKALEVCELVQVNLVDQSGHLRKEVPREQIFMAIHVHYVRASLLQMNAERYSGQVLDGFSHAIDLALTPPLNKGTEQPNLRDLIVSTCLCGMHLSHEFPVPKRVTRLLGFDDRLDFKRPGFDILDSVHRLGNRLIALLHEIGFDILPSIILDPEQIESLPQLLFTSSLNVLPSNCTHDSSGNLALLPGDICAMTNRISSKIIHIIINNLQNSLTKSFSDRTFQSFRVSTSLVIALYHLALALYPSAVTYNNLGTLVSTLSPSISVNGTARSKVTHTERFPMAYYERGLQIDSNQAHLLTNMGSALREKGAISDAIRLYNKAIEKNPELGVAYVNLGDTIRDTKRPWDAIPFYRRALELQPFPEAVCGIANALSSICDWRDRGWLKPELEMIKFSPASAREQASQREWIVELFLACHQQLQGAYAENNGLLRRIYSLQDWMAKVQLVYDRPLSRPQWRRWETRLLPFYTEFDRVKNRVNEGGYVVRLMEWLTRGLQRRWYIETYGSVLQTDQEERRPEWSHQAQYERPIIPSSGHFPVPALLPFQAFSFPLDPRTIRLISHRNSLRVSYITLSQPWLPKYVYPPPSPPYEGRLNIGYVSHDFADHPLAHLAQSIFGFHDPELFNVHAYATSPDDGSTYREKIAKICHKFLDVSSWKLEKIIKRIVDDQIHILINLGGFTLGSKNDIFAARPCPVQIVMLGFPGSIGAGWCDYLVSDETSSPRDMRARLKDTENALIVGIEADPESESNDWVFTEKMIYMPDTFMVTDHKQSYNNHNPSYEEALDERTEIRQAIFPDLSPHAVIFANFNQLYKIDPVIFAKWLSILRRVPESVLWLLRFPAAGEEHLKRTAKTWANEEVASRIRFTNVAPKEEHLRRGCVADLFLDTAECNAHTVAADVLWSGTPILTWPKHRHKMCSRVGASIAKATGFGDQMVVDSVEMYEERAVSLALQEQSTRADKGINAESELMSLRRNLYNNRQTMPLFDTKRWTKNFERACQEVWKRWVTGVEFSDTMTDDTTCILVTDEEKI